MESERCKGIEKKEHRLAPMWSLHCLCECTTGNNFYVVVWKLTFTTKCFREMTGAVSPDVAPLLWYRHIAPWVEQGERIVAGPGREWWGLLSLNGTGTISWGGPDNCANLVLQPDIFKVEDGQFSSKGLDIHFKNYLRKISLTLLKAKREEITFKEAKVKMKNIWKRNSPRNERMRHWLWTADFAVPQLFQCIWVH